MSKPEINKLDAWSIISERDEINNRFLRIRNVTFRLPNDEVMEDYFIAEKSNVVVIILIKDGKTYLIKEWERGVGTVGHKFPAGRVDMDESSEAAASREALEEVGLNTVQLIFLGETFVDPGFLSTMVSYFICEEFEEDEDGKIDDPLELFEGEWVSFDSIETMIYENEIKNPYVIVGYFLAKNYLSKLGS